MLTEYDARNLREYLDAAEIDFSSDFLAFKRSWSRDEWNHYLGFRRIYATLYHESEDEIAKQLEVDHGDFDVIAEYLQDEFQICLLLAYDEIATAKSYLSEFPFYRSFGDQRVFRWFQRVTVDEINHCRNCMEILIARHPQRLAQIPENLDRFIEWDTRKSPYGRTFVLDHYWYSPSFLDHCRRVIAGYLKHGLRGQLVSTKIETSETAPLFARYRYF
jgi:hypothetical protein